MVLLFMLECHDDTLQCGLWAHHGHCKGIAYSEFMKRHCKATCGYCGKGRFLEKCTGTFLGLKSL